VTRTEAILEGLAYAGLDDDLASAVDAQLDQPREAWPPCCNSGCEPCVEQVARATLRARVLLGLGDPA
jgi:hypothetical protein